GDVVPWMVRGESGDIPLRNRLWWRVDAEGRLKPLQKGAAAAMVRGPVMPSPPPVAGPPRATTARVPMTRTVVRAATAKPPVARARAVPQLRAGGPAPR